MMNNEAYQLLSSSLEKRVVTNDEQKLEQLRITHDKELPPMKFLFRISDTPCFPRDELVAVTGKAKSGKTIFTSILMACCAKSQVLQVNAPSGPLRCLWYDTEQSEQSTQDILINRILPMTEDPSATAPPNEVQAHPFDIFNVRCLHYDDRLRLFETAVRKYHPDLVVLDGVRDLVADINDGVKAQELVEGLMTLAQSCHCCIVCVLHQNKNGDDRNLRGWIGTEMMNKSFEVYSCEKLMPHRIFSVEQTLTRKYDLDQILYFQVDGNGLPTGCEAPASATKRDTSSGGKEQEPLNREYIISRYNGFDIDLRLLFHKVLKNGPRFYSDLQVAAMQELHCHDTHFWNKQFSLAKEQGIICRSLDTQGRSTWALTGSTEQPTPSICSPQLSFQGEAEGEAAPPF